MTNYITKVIIVKYDNQNFLNDRVTKTFNNIYFTHILLSHIVFIRKFERIHFRKSLFCDVVA